MADAQRTMTLLEHLEELRRRLFACLLVVVAGGCVAYAGAGRVLAWLARPLHATRLVFLNPFEAFMTYINIAMIGGVVLALPVIAYQVWGYVSPALSARERRWVAGGCAASVALFLTGMAVAYFVVIPLGLRFLMGFSSALLQPMFAVGSYVSTVGWLLLVFGAAFQLPIVLILLTVCGVVSAQQLARWRPYVIVGLTFVAAAATPGPDVLSQIALLVPLWLLFELSLVISSRITHA